MRAPDPPRVELATMRHQWRLVTFLHWRYPAEVVQALVPKELRVQEFDGTAWVGLVPFEMRGVRPPGLPPAPWLSRFPETNVRTYVEGPDGTTGIYFFSLDATRLPAVLAARLSFGLPYFWCSGEVRVGGGRMRYRGRRRWPGPRGASYYATVRVGAAIAEERLGPLDHFLTARYRLFTRVGGRSVAVDVEHPPWPLHRAELLDLRQELISAAGLPAPDGVPLVHASPGVAVRIGVPQTVNGV